ncbi:MAG: hypothetical protein EBR82_50480 [Caulobacteraceae bacterium]|nr:hypothetical protein [Caulobacteraceae bacterium]
MANADGGQMIVSERDALEAGMEPVDIWLAQIQKAKDDESAWRKEATNALEIYEGGETGTGKTAQRISFNIYHSNIETMVPAAYNSTPIPDIRRRYDDPDPISKMGVDIIEKGLRGSGVRAGALGSVHSRPSPHMGHGAVDCV